jgi:hypothetical protein
MNNRLTGAAILGIGIALSGLFIGQGFVVARNNLQSVEVKGLAEKVVKANEGVWTINLKVVNNDMGQLYQEISRVQANCKKFLLEQGFQEADISMNPVSVMDNQSVTYNQNKDIPRYSADMGLNVSSNKVDQIAQALQKTGELVQQGIVVTSSSANYRFTDLNSIKPQMLEEATKSARIAAERFASDAKTALGSIRHASQGLFTISDANSNFDSGTTIYKKVRIVTTIEYQLS